MSDTFTVEVTQYHRPRGRKTLEHTQLPNDCAVGYEALTRKNCRLTAESIFSNVNLCIEHDAGDYVSLIVPNGPEVQRALANAVRAFDVVKFDQWLEAVTK
jgi:hypothetical protein